MDAPTIAIVADVPELTPAELDAVVVALQTQVDRDFGPIWGVAAKVIGVAAGEPVPADAWTVTITRHAGSDQQAGFHSDQAGRPYATIEYDSGWSLAASHELLEMLVDPLGEQLRPGPAPTDGTAVQFLVEVCDPCQESAHAYEIGGVTVSDFLTPAYYEPGTTSPCSFRGGVQAPFEVLPGGYVTWQVPGSGDVWQGHWPLGGGKADVRLLGSMPDLAAQNKKLREWVDAETLRRGMPGSPHAAPA